MPQPAVSSDFFDRAGTAKTVLLCHKIYRTVHATSLYCARPKTPWFKIRPQKKLATTLSFTQFSPLIQCLQQCYNIFLLQCFSVPIQSTLCKHPNNTNKIITTPTILTLCGFAIIESS